MLHDLDYKTKSKLKPKNLENLEKFLKRWILAPRWLLSCLKAFITHFCIFDAFNMILLFHKRVGEMLNVFYIDNYVICKACVCYSLRCTNG